jgi:FHA domain
MTTYAPSHTQQTAPLEAPTEDLTRDAVPLLDHRTRERLKEPRMCRRGPHLAFEDGDRTLLLALEAKITHIGRGLTAHVRFEDPRVSRDHAIIVRHGRFARLLDNRSANGTYLNGRRVLATNLAHGDVVRVGPVAAQYLEVD